MIAGLMVAVAMIPVVAYTREYDGDGVGDQRVFVVVDVEAGGRIRQLPSVDADGRDPDTSERITWVMVAAGAVLSMWTRTRCRFLDSVTVTAIRWDRLPRPR